MSEQPGGELILYPRGEYYGQRFLSWIIMLTGFREYPETCVFREKGGFVSTVMGGAKWGILYPDVPGDY